MKVLAALSTALVLLSLAPGSVGADDGDAGSLLRSRKLSNTVSYSSPTTGIVGSYLKPDPASGLPQAFLKDKILNALRACVEGWTSGEKSCNVYFNPHTKYSYYRNPSAVGALRNQLIYSGTSTGPVQGKTTYFFDVPEATSEIIDAVMSETGLQFSGGARGDCVNNTYTELGPGVASAVAKVSWKTGGNNAVNSNEITLLSSTIVLKKVTTKDIRCKWCTGTFETIDGAALTCTESDDPCIDNNNCQDEVYFNTDLIGSHLHVGGSMTDGPPPVFFCKDAPLKPGATRFYGDDPGLCLTGDNPVYD